MSTGKFTSQAIAYLKAHVPTSAIEPCIELSGLDAPVLCSLGNGLLVGYVVDVGEHFEYVQERHLAAENCTNEELNAVGLANLEQRAVASLQVATHPCGEMFAALMGGNFEASLILLDDVWEHGFRSFVSGDYIVAIPARDILAFCDASSAAGLRELRSVCETAMASGADHPLSKQLYRRVGSQWQIFEAEQL